ncbi:MAG: hypothetical protein KDD61_01265 [Bdellovibrionales bacterium]|nr:hypothetical protein [Bdellovibrionales bacterium]
MSDSLLIELFCLNLFFLFLASLLYFLGTEALVKVFVRTKGKDKSQTYY